MRLSDSPVVFTHDANYFFSCNSKSIRILSVETGQVVRILSSSVAEGGHSDTVTSVLLNPRNKLQLYSCSLDGTIKLWDFNDAVLLKTYEVGVPITHMVMHESIPNEVYIASTKKSTKRFHMYQQKKAGGLRAKENSVLLRYSFKSSRKRLVRLLKSRSCSGLAISADGEYIVMAGRYKLHVIHIAAGNGIQEGGVTENDEARFRCYITPEKISAVAFHPKEGCIATGDERGRITLWYCFGKNVDRPITTTLHWHAHQVAALAFTHDGTYLLSGGEESVLVIWQIATGFKQFLPRLGSEIKHLTVSPKDEVYAVGHQDNSVNIVRSVDLKIATAVQGLKFSHTNHLTNPLSTGLVVEPRNGHIVLNGLPGTLQFYNPVQEQHIMELEVTPRNKVSRTDDKEIVAPHVKHVAFSSDQAARWMVTVDGRNDNETTPEMYLKFWEYNDDIQNYVLNTRVDSPHSKEITACIFNPRKGAHHAPMVVTTSLDGTFKVWELTHQGEARRGIEAEKAWSCRSTGFYRDLEPLCASFAFDGSLLAVSYGQIVTLWDPYLNTMQGVLTQPPENRPIRHLTFLKDSPFLISATKDHLYSWNLLTCSVWWSYQIKTELLQASQNGSQFMVSTPNPKSNSSEYHVIVFDPTQPTPVTVESVKKKIRAFTFLPDVNETPSSTASTGATTTSGSAKNKTEPILIMNHAYDLELIGGRTAEELKVEAEEAAAAAKAALDEKYAQQQQKSHLSDIFGSSSTGASVAAAQAAARKAAKKESAAALRGSSRKNFGRNPLFDAPSHVMAPVSSLFESFMAQMLVNSKVVKEPSVVKSKEEKASETKPSTTTTESMEQDDGKKEEDDDLAVDIGLSQSLSNFFLTRVPQA